MDPITNEKWNDILRYQRKKRGWTQEQMADKLYALVGGKRARGDINANMISRWELGKHPPSLFYQEKLSLLFEMSLEELGLLTKQEIASNGSGIIEQDESAQDTEDDDMDRRQALQALGLGTSFVIADPSLLSNLKEIDAYFNRRHARLSTWLLDSLERETYLRWHLYYTSSNSQAEEGLLKQISHLEHIADDAGRHQNRVYRLLGQSYQLAGSLARDNFFYTRAKTYFEQAYEVATEAGITDLAATSVARLALVLLRQENISDALVLYQRAAGIAARAEPQVRAYVLNSLAEAYARNGHRDECYQALDQAEVQLDRAKYVPPEEDIAQVRLTLQSIEDTRGECYVLCGEPEKGLQYLQAAQQHLDATISRNHCRLLMQQSEAHLAAGHLDYAVQFALQGLRLARILGSKGNINWASEIYAKLLCTGWQGEPAVKGLELAIKEA